MCYNDIIPDRKGVMTHGEKLVRDTNNSILKFRITLVIKYSFRTMERKKKQEMKKEEPGRSSFFDVPMGNTCSFASQSLKALRLF